MSAYEERIVEERARRAAARARIPQELRDDGWDCVDDDGFELFWIHPPSQRSIRVTAQEHGGRSDFFVICHVHDELGNPVDGSALDPMPFAEAVRRARAVRASILAERKDVRVVEQGELFPEGER